MSLRSASPALSDGEVRSGDEEKAISTNTTRNRDSKVNTSTRTPHNGSSSRSARPLSTNHVRDPYHRSRDEAWRGRLPPGGRERSRSPFRRARSGSRSPFRADKTSGGEKRRRAEDHYRGGSDPRRFKVHYEEGEQHSGTARPASRSYADLDRPELPKGVLQYDDDQSSNGHGSRRGGRDRSRSPYRPGKAERTSDRRDGPRKASEHQARSYGQPGSSDGPSKARPDAAYATQREPEASHRKDNAKIKVSLSQHSQTPAVATTQSRQEAKNVEEAPAAEKQEPEPKLSETDIIEQRRKRREAIKARHKAEPPLLKQALEQSMPFAPATPAQDSSGPPSEQQSPPSSVDSPRTPQRDSPPGSPAAFAVNDDEELANRNQAVSATNDDDEGPSAADYDPNMDMQEDRPDHKRSTIEAAMSDAVTVAETQPEQAAAPKAGKEFDMFADEDDDDMFAQTETANKASVAGTKQGTTLDQSLLDNWDYPDGHYRIMLGELLNGRYAVQQQVGKGTFATVVRAQDTETGNAVAIKIAANNETMAKAGQKEMDFLALLNQNDPEDKKHIIRLLRSFDHKGHMCIVFEALSADLREVLKKFGRNVGLNLKAIRSYAQQMFYSLSHMKKCQILHADLKPDNILVSEKRNLLKICDLGTASFADDAEVTPYLVSRFYRAPEVILGMPFDYAIDMWSIGCTLFELYTGRILFAGADNNQMLRAIQECRGKFPIRMLKKSTLADKHFDFDGNFFSQERDKVTGRVVVRQVHFNRSTEGKDLKSRLSSNVKGLAPAELKEHAAFVDLLERCLQVDPAKRITPNDALRHGFVMHGGQQPTNVEKPKIVPAMGIPVARKR